ncbi:MAG: GLPGLI family protein [Bacteroidota bacterium]|nr:GLPGLI family protein [Bacteroidota bacterium]
MKKISLSVVSICLILLTFAQQKEGKVIYQRTAQMRINIAGNDQLQQMLPKSRTDKFELTFGNNQSIWKHVDEDDNADEINGNGMQIRMMAPGQNDIVYFDFINAKTTEQRDMFGKNFIVTDSIRKLNWKLTGESQTMLGHVCQKAIAQRTGKRMQMTMDNGKMERKEINDTTNIVAWFTPDIPVPAGPEVQGQLPGLILSLDMNNGRVVYKALEITAKADVASIKEPTKGKKVTADEFTKERDKMMAEMQKNNQGGNRTFRIQN